MKREKVIYEGEFYTIEWFFNFKGESQAPEYYNSLDDEQRREFLFMVKRMGDSGKILNKTKFNYEGNHIYAFKPKPHRFLCFFYTGKKIIITHAFCKKQQKLPAKEKIKALSVKKNYELRIKTGNYYE